MLYVKYGKNQLHGFRESEKKSFENVDGWTGDGRRMPAYTISSPIGELIMGGKVKVATPPAL